MNAGVIILIVLLAGGFIAWGIYDGIQRRKMLRAWALSKRLSFSAARDRGLDDRYPEVKCLHYGHSRYACNVMTGQLSGLPITAFDYHYTTGHGKHRKNHRISVLIAKSPVALKPLHIRREHLFDKVTEFFGLDDIDFESAEFSRKFFVKADDKRWAYDVIHQRMMDYLLAAPSFSLQFDWGHVIAWRSRRFAHRDFEAAAELIKGILDRLPKYVLQQQAELKWKPARDSHRK